MTVPYSQWLSPAIAPVLPTTARPEPGVHRDPQLRAAVLDHGHLYLFIFYVALTWLVWIVKVALSSRYRPVDGAHEATTSVVIPVVDEPLDLFRDVLARIVEQGPDADHRGHQRAPQRRRSRRSARSSLPPCAWTWTPVAGKRNAVRVGVEHSRRRHRRARRQRHGLDAGHAAPSCVKPFADARRRRGHHPAAHPRAERCFLTRWADWMENSRALYSMPAQSVLGAVGCLPGRTIAFRRAILVDVMDDFMTAAVPRRLPRGLRRPDADEPHAQAGATAPSTSRPASSTPTRRCRCKKLLKQQLRWSRGSQYNTLRMLPWMLRHTPDAGVLLRQRHRHAVPAARRRHRLGGPSRPGHRRQPLHRAAAGRGSARDAAGHRAPSPSCSPPCR